MPCRSPARSRVALGAGRRVLHRVGGMVSRALVQVAARAVARCGEVLKTPVGEGGEGQLVHTWLYPSAACFGADVYAALWQFTQAVVVFL